ncbi:hypothetical protein CgunFtcFv8_012596 [Champsocephalus gunnari]|uniref:Uncharacterized protein n=1 Tax=Champsocephalus gunnari TaxID=52237 RepID=A0AAN8DQV1_CHAGU|nr:hypothetical protein CgunFtcFv8_012596 [Champsocephalus gunnari]
MPSSPTDLTLHFTSLQELRSVVVGSGSEGSTGLKINSLTPGLWTAAMVVVSLEETQLSSYNTVKDLQDI